jgi:hypothetical protein
MELEINNPLKNVDSLGTTIDSFKDDIASLDTDDVRDAAEKALDAAHDFYSGMVSNLLFNHVHFIS